MPNNFWLTKGSRRSSPGYCCTAKTLRTAMPNCFCVVKKPRTSTSDYFWIRKVPGEVPPNYLCVAKQPQIPMTRCSRPVVGQERSSPEFFSEVIRPQFQGGK